ncbi:MAG: hypothetical protein L0332_33760 [Chloroflexi bacterium]|nr:hypothetical protein [Chloroflexota bacterium]MCI0578761.1 hypothetical protein [Chloroflexota bacterium]MCI0648742.1 hypothetical protein [Chloroflexota bacterium]MCI0731670.1 hypothetical protein [Chloroflexota bacterium]
MSNAVKIAVIAAIGVVLLVVVAGAAVIYAQGGPGEVLADISAAVGSRNVVAQNRPQGMMNGRGMMGQGMPGNMPMQGGMMGQGMQGNMPMQGGMMGQGMMNGQGMMGGMPGGMACPMGQNGQGMMDHEAMHAAVAEALNMTVEEFEAAIAEGKTLVEIAAGQEVDIDEVWAVMQAAHAEAIAQAVEDGLMTQEQADWMLAHMNSMSGPGGGPHGLCPFQGDTDSQN